jgi:acyl-coenzyme A thioesterase PaaI-like protein
MTASPVTTPPPGALVPALNENEVNAAYLIKTSSSGSCFGCGTDHAGGLKLQRTGYDGMTATGYIEITDQHQGVPGFAHGGLLATAMDEIVGTASWLLARKSVTGRLETDYRLPVPVGSILYVKAWCTGVEGRKIYLEGEGRLGSPDGPLAVRAAALFIEVPPDHFARISAQEALVEK